MVMTWTSLCATCDISCAMTASSSSGVNLGLIISVVTQRTALSALRPVAKAFGKRDGAMAIRGLGMSASAHTRSTMPCRYLACSPSFGPTTTARAVLSAILSE